MAVKFEKLDSIDVIVFDLGIMKLLVCFLLF